MNQQCPLPCETGQWRQCAAGWSRWAFAGILSPASTKKIFPSCNKTNIHITLINLNETKIHKFCPMTKYGDIDKILQNRDLKLAECPAKEPKTTLGVASEFGSVPSDEELKSEVYQRFGSRAKSSFTYMYTLNTLLSVDAPNADRLLEPTQWFVGITKDTTLNVRDCLSYGSIPFSGGLKCPNSPGEKSETAPCDSIAVLIAEVTFIHSF